MDHDEVVQSFQEFLIVLIHLVAYRCDVYPESTFSLVRQYGTSTWQNNHPGFCTWAERAAATATGAIGVVDKPGSISIVVLENNVPTSRVAVALEPLDALTDMISVSPLDLESKYQAALAVFTTMPIDRASSRSISELENIDKTMTLVFKGQVNNDDSEIGGNDSPWMPSEKGDPDAGTIVPVRYIDAPGVFGLNVFYQALKR